MSCRSDPKYGLVPNLVREVIGWLDQHALDQPGCWRLPGEPEAVLRLKKRYDRGESAVLESCESMGNVTALMLRFLNELPEG